MSWSGGTFTRTNGDKTGIDVWQQDNNAGINIVDSRHDAHDQDLAEGINTCLTRDGQNGASANLPMGGHRHANVGNAAARNDYAAAGQVQDGSLAWGGTASGSDTITFNLTPAITAYATGMVVGFAAAGANTGPVTININGVGAKTLYVNGAALAGAEIATGDAVVAVYDGTRFNMVHPIVESGTNSIQQGLHAIAMTTRSIPIGTAPSNVTTGSATSPYYGRHNFDPITEEYAWYPIILPQSWDEVDLKVQIIWEEDAAATAHDVVWGLSACATGDGDAKFSALGTEVTFTDTGAAGTLQITPVSAAITPGGSPAAGDMIYLKLARKAADGADTLDVDAVVHSIRLLFTINAATDA